MTATSERIPAGTAPGPYTFRSSMKIAGVGEDGGETGRANSVPSTEDQNSSGDAAGRPTDTCCRPRDHLPVLDRRSCASRAASGQRGCASRIRASSRSTSSSWRLPGSAAPGLCRQRPLRLIRAPHRALNAVRAWPRYKVPLGSLSPPPAGREGRPQRSRREQDPACVEARTRRTTRAVKRGAERLLVWVGGAYGPARAGGAGRGRTAAAPQSSSARWECAYSGSSSSSV